MPTNLAVVHGAHAKLDVVNASFLALGVLLTVHNFHGDHDLHSRQLVHLDGGVAEGFEHADDV